MKLFPHLMSLLFARRNLTLAIVLLGTTLICFGKDWNGIQPLISTKKDVERILGRGTFFNLHAWDYKKKNQKIMVIYAEGNCTERKDSRWNVSRDVVLSIHISYKEPMPLNEFLGELTGFEKNRGADDLPGTFYYLNEDIGMSMEVSESFATPIVVTSAHYFPRKDERVRSCQSIGKDIVLAL